MSERLYSNYDGKSVPTVAQQKAKPDDIPQDVILEAQRYAYETETSGDDVAAITSEIGVRVIARAIMAEREANSQVTGAMVDAGAHVLEKRFGMGQPWEELCEMSDAVLQAALTQA